MKRVAKISALFLLFIITLISSIGMKTYDVQASTISNDEILEKANFSEEIIGNLSDYTKEGLANQVESEQGFDYKIMTLSETQEHTIQPMGQIPDEDLIIIVTTSIHKIENSKIKEIKVKVYYEWINLPIWRLEDPIIISWDSEKFSYQTESFYSEDRYVRDGDYLHASRRNYYERNLDTFCWYADLKAGYFLGIGGTIQKLYGFGELVLDVKEEYQTSGVSSIGATYVHSKVEIETGISIYAEVGFKVPTTGNDQVSTDAFVKWNAPITVMPMDYGYEQQYFFYEKTKPVTLASEEFNTTRLRCGYIEEEYIVLSPRRKDAGNAYLIYSFNNNITQLNVDLTMWSSTEYLYSNDSRALLQYKNESGNWVTILDLLNDITLSTDRNNPTNYTILFPQNTKEFRFYVTSTATGTRNKGRICIGTMEIFIEQ